MARLTPVARRLRRDMTDAERRLWSRLRGKQLGAAFTRQYAIGNAIVDFACRRLRLAIEVDGGQHSDSGTDDVRTREIEASGYRVIRFWNHDVLENTDGVVIRILEEIEIARATYSPPPVRGRVGWGSAMPRALETPPQPLPIGEGLLRGICPRMHLD